MKTNKNTECGFYTTSRILKKGDIITYLKEYMFKNSRKVTAKVVAITKSGYVLLDNGDEFLTII